ncbi:hypothetical protein DAT36_06670 [Photobacterium phosphoreum]|nr:hypothetical protein DAT36_06670 [Photobacterium phosphoreum]
MELWRGIAKPVSFFAMIIGSSGFIFQSQCYAA